MSNKYPKNTQTYAVNNYKPELVMSKLNNFNKTYNQNYSSQLRSSDTKDTKDQRKGPIKYEYIR